MPAIFTAFMQLVWCALISCNNLPTVFPFDVVQRVKLRRIVANYKFAKFANLLRGQCFLLYGIQLGKISDTCKETVTWVKKNSYY